MMKDCFDVVAEFNEIVDKIEKAMPECKKICMDSKTLGLKLLGNDLKEYDRWTKLFNIFAQRSYIAYIRERRMMYAVYYVQEMGKGFNTNIVANILGLSDYNQFIPKLQAMDNAPDDITPTELAEKGDVYGLCKPPFSIILDIKKGEYVEKEDIGYEHGYEYDGRIDKINEYMNTYGGIALIAKIAIYLIKQYKQLPWDEAIEFSGEYVRYVYFKMADNGTLTAKAIIDDLSQKIGILGIWLQGEFTIKEAEYMLLKGKEKYDVEEILKERSKSLMMADQIFERNKQQQFYDINKPNVSFDEYYQYLDDYGSRTKLADYHEYYVCRVEYEKQLKRIGSFEEFRKKYAVYQTKTKGKLSYDDYYEFWDLYRRIAPKEPYESFRDRMKEIVSDFKQKYSELVEICPEVTANDFKELYPMLLDSDKKKACYRIVKAGYYPKPTLVNGVYALCSRYCERFSIKDIIESCILYKRDIDSLVTEFEDYVKDCPKDTIKDYVLKSCIYDCRERNISMADYYQYYDYYVLKGGTDNLSGFDHHIHEHCLSECSIINGRHAKLNLNEEIMIDLNGKVEDLRLRQEYPLFKDIYEKASRDNHYHECFPFDFYTAFDFLRIEKKNDIYKKAGIDKPYLYDDCENDDYECGEW